MKLIIDIPEEDYEYIKKSKDSNFNVIKNGTPLPKCKTCQEWDTNNRIDGACYCCNWHNYTGEDFYCGDWVRKTIIEADKGE